MHSYYKVIHIIKINFLIIENLQISDKKKRKITQFSTLKIATVKILVSILPIICVIYIFIDIITMLHMILTLSHSPVVLT